MSVVVKMSNVVFPNCLCRLKSHCHDPLDPQLLLLLKQNMFLVFALWLGVSVHTWIMDHPACAGLTKEPTVDVRVKPRKTVAQLSS